MNLPATSRDSSKSGRVLVDLCIYCTCDHVFSFLLVILWTIVRPARCPSEIRDPLDHSGSFLSQAISYSHPVNCPYPLNGASAIAITDLWPPWEVPLRRSLLWKNVWAVWNIQWESSKIILKNRAACLHLPLARMGKVWNPSTKICVSSEKNLNPLQRDRLISKKTFSPNSKML